MERRRDEGLFADIELATRIEAAELGMTLGGVAAAREDGQSDARSWEIAGGVAAYCGPDSPFTKMIGVGLEGPPRPDQLEEIELAHDALEIGVRAEISSLAPQTAACLSTRGYEIEGFENVLGCPLTGALDPGPSPTDFEIGLAAHGELDAWIETLVDAFAIPDAGVPEESFPRDALVRVMRQMTNIQGVSTYAAHDGRGRLLAAASLRVDGEVAQLCGAGTRVEARRCGLQSALIRRRLHDAAQQGAKVAVVTTTPGSPSQLNLMRLGFGLLYSRVVLVRAP